MYKTYFFDMDGTLFDSMPHHAEAWERVMARHGLRFTAEDCYINEGRTGEDVITDAFQQVGVTDMPLSEVQAIYREKTELFHSMGEVQPIAGVKDVLQYLKEQGASLWIVTGSGQQTLFDVLDHHFPGIFARERMITAFDVTHGKPDPEPYLKAWEQSGYPKEECCVVENAPLGLRSGKAAGLFSIGVNTGPLRDELLWEAGADEVIHDMPELLEWVKDN